MTKKEALNNLVRSEARGRAQTELLVKIYDQSLRIIDNQIRSIFGTMEAFDELSSLMKASDRVSFITALERSMARLNLKVGDVYSRGYLVRLTRLQALQTAIYWEILAIAPQEQEVVTRLMEQVYRGSFASAMAGIRLEMFASPDTRAINAILNSEFKGATYSERIWKNTDELAKRLPVLIGSNMASGAGYETTKRILMKEFDVGKYEATRLVRTELNRFHNRAEIDAYKEAGVEMYEYLAFLDNRTSHFCDPRQGGLGGQVFLVSEAVEGFNYPPLHPNCRSTTRAILSNDKEAKKVLRQGQDYKSYENELVFID